MKKRLCSILLGLYLVLTMLPTMALAAGGEDGTQANPWNISAEGEGNNVTAYLERNDDGPTYTLVISGSGAMKDFKFSSPSGYWTSDAPWHTALTVDSSTNRYPITALEIGDGITHIGSAAFASLSIPEISFKRNVTSYGTYVYISCTAVTTVDWTNFSIETIPEGLLLWVFSVDYVQKWQHDLRRLCIDAAGYRDGHWNECFLWVHKSDPC